MGKLIEQGPDAYGLWWYRIYHITDCITFRMVTASIGEPDETPFRIWWGLVYKEGVRMIDFQETLKRNALLSPYVTWRIEEGTEFMSFSHKDFDTILDLVTQAVLQMKNDSVE